jgi:DNA-binding MarR family transcriptional regulator
MKVKEENKSGFAEAMIRLANAMKNETENCAKMCGVVTEKELTVIFFVGKNKHVKMSDIAANIDAPMSTLTSIVDKLVEKKLLSRDHSGEDRRVVNVSLAPTGKTAFGKLIDKQKKVAEVVLSQLNEKEQALITKHLNLIVAQMAKLE